MEWADQSPADRIHDLEYINSRIREYEASTDPVDRNWMKFYQDLADECDVRIIIFEELEP